MPNKTDTIAILIVFLTSFVIPISMVAYHFVVEKQNPTVYEVRIQEDGGWPDAAGPNTIEAKPGDTLKFISLDVTHSFRVNITLTNGDFLIIDQVIYPGHVTEVHIPDNSQPGQYLIRCNVWCSHAHYVMTGILRIIPR